MRQDVEKLMMWLIPLVAIATIAETALTNFVLELVAAMKNGASASSSEINWLDHHFSTGEQITIAKGARIIPMFAVQLAIGIWLFSQAKAKNANRWVWLLSGLLLKYWALAFFLLVQVIETKQENGATANK